MGYLKYVRSLFKKPTEQAQHSARERLIQIRREPTTLRLDRPTNIARARSIGYRPKQGVLVVRQRVARGGRQRPDIKGGRRSKHSSQRKVVKKNYQQVAEERANRAYKNCEVVNSYKVAEDGIYAWYEVILVDRYHPVVLADKQLAQVAVHRGRTFRGKSAAGKKARGHYRKGQGTEKNRPSLRARKRLH